MYKGKLHTTDWEQRLVKWSERLPVEGTVTKCSCNVPCAPIIRLWVHSNYSVNIDYPVLLICSMEEKLFHIYFGGSSQTYKFQPCWICMSTLL